MWANPQFPADLVSFTEEILNGKLHVSCKFFPYSPEKRRFNPLTTGCPRKSWHETDILVMGRNEKKETFWWIYLFVIKILNIKFCDY